MSRIAARILTGATSTLRGLRAGLRSPGHGAWLVLGLLGLATAFLWPTLWAPYLSDDQLTSLMPGRQKYHGQTLVGYTLEEIRDWMRLGRFFPLSHVELQATFHLFQEHLHYRLFIFGMVLLDLLLFVVLIRKLTGSLGFACLAAALTLMLFQLRAWHDAILSFHGLMQLAVAGMLASLIALEDFLEGRGRARLYLSAGIYLVCMFMYESVYPLFLLHLLLIARRRPGWGPAARASWPFAQAVGICLFMTFFLRWLGPTDSPIYKLNLEPVAIASTLVRQTSTALPLTYFAADPHEIFKDLGTWAEVGRFLGRGDALAVGGAALAFCGLCLYRLRAEAAAGRRWWSGSASLILLGLLLAVVPGAMISLTSRYQGEVKFFSGYISVYFQYFGMGLLLAAGACGGLAGLRRFGLPARGLALALAALVGLATGATYRANCRTIDCFTASPGSEHFRVAASGMEGRYHPQRRNLELALRSGLMADVPEHSVVLTSNEYSRWYQGQYAVYFYAMNASKIFAVVPPSVADGSSPDLAAHRELLARHPVRMDSIYRVRDIFLAPKTGYVVLSRVGSSEGSRLFVRHPRLFRDATMTDFAVAGWRRNSGDSKPYAVWGQGLRLLRSGPDWAMFSLDSDSGSIDPESLRVVFNPEQASWSQVRRFPPERFGTRGGTLGGGLLTSEAGAEGEQLAFGPYVDLQAGSYRAVFFLGLDQAARERPVEAIEIDVFRVNHGFLARETIEGEALKALIGGVRPLALDFRLDRPLESVEFRVKVVGHPARARVQFGGVALVEEPPAGLREAIARRNAAHEPGVRR